MLFETLEHRLQLAVVTVNWSSTNQTIDGLGASSAWVTQSLTTSQQQLLYSTTKGIGLSTLRSRMLPDTSASSWEINTMQKAVAMGVKVWSTPWSPPAAWKDNNNVNNGGALLPSRYQDYANLLAQYVKNMNTNGIPLYAISLQNEPDWTATYESCRWTAAQFAAFLPYVHNAWVSNSLTAKIILPEELGWHFSLASTITSDPVLNTYFDILAGHNYNGTPGIVPQAAGHQLWETEVFDTNTAHTGIDTGLWTATNIYNFLQTSKANAWHYWWINRANNGGLLDGNWQPTKQFWATANYAKFVRPGWVNVGKTDDGGLLSSAYKNAATGDFSIVLVNNGTSAITETINLNGAYAPTLTPWITSATLDLAQQQSIPTTGNGSSYSYTIQAKSVVTLTGTASTTPVTAAPPGLLAAAAGTTSINLSWTNNVTTATGYTLQRSTNGSTWSTLSSSINTSTFSYSDAGLSNNTTYYYRVIANNGTIYSNVAYDTTTLNAPGNLIASYNTSTQNVTLNWTASSSASVDYSVDRSTDGTTWTNINAGIASGTTNFTDTSAPELTTVYYRIRAVYGENTSAYTSTVNVVTTILKAPSLLTAAIGSTANTVVLNWTNNTGTAATVSVERSSNGGSTWTVLGSVATGVSTYTDPTVSSGNSYVYRVRAQFNAINSAYSSTATISMVNWVITPVAGNNTYYLKKNSDGLHIDLWQNATTPGTGTPTQSVLFNQYSSISITGGTSNDSLTVDYSLGTPMPSGGITFDGISGSDQLFTKGVSGTVSSTIADGSVKFGTETIGYSHLDNVTLDLGASTTSLLSTTPVTTPILTLIVATGGVVTLAASSTLPTNTILSLAGTLNLAGQSESIDQLTGAGNISNSGGTLTLGANNGNSLYSGVFSGAGGLIKTGTGTATLTGGNSYTGSTTVKTGTLTFSPTISANIGSSTTSVYIAPGNTDNAILNIGPGVTLNAGTPPFGGIFLGCNSNSNNAGGVGVLNQTGGIINNSGLFYIGGANTVANGANGTFNLSGGIANMGATINLSINNNSISNLNISGTGQLRVLNNSNLLMGRYFGRPATITQTGGSVTFYSDSGTTVGGTGYLDMGTGGGIYTLNLNGGTFVVPRIVASTFGSTPKISFSGGTLQATALSTDFIASTSSSTSPAQQAISIRSSTGGARFNTNGFSITINQAISHDPTLGATIDGGLYKTGSGTLRLNASPGYTGQTSTTGGKLLLSGGAIQNGSPMTIATGGIVEVTPGGNASSVTSIGMLNISGTGSTLELHNNDLIINYSNSISPINSITQQLHSGLQLLGGAGISGISSEEVDAQTLSATILAAIDDGAIDGGITSVSGFNVPDPQHSIVIKYTWFGDTNFDGMVDGTDYALIDTGFTSNGALISWIFGDLDSNGAVDGADYALIDSGFIAQSTIL